MATPRPTELPRSPVATVRYRVCHETVYDYAHPVTSARQLAHLQPRTTDWQSVFASTVRIDPTPGEQSEGLDYFGNRVLRFAIDGAHERLAVTASSELEVRPHTPTPRCSSPPWHSATRPPLDLMAPGALDIIQFQNGSPMAPALIEAGRYAARSFVGERPWLEAMLDLTCRIKSEFTYDPSATTVSTPVSDVLSRRRGVCQDFAHLMLSALRALRLPARYVSGYIRNDRPAGTSEALTGADASHAWVSAYCPGHGWVDFDPTNGKLADTEFITAAWGRDFSDVTPLRGVVLGEEGQSLEVRVTVRAL